MRHLFQQKNRFLLLIACSLMLLGVSQALWLRKVWAEQKELLGQQVNFQFLQTVADLQDSLVLRSVREKAAPDSFVLHLPRIHTETTMRTQVRKFAGPPTDLPECDTARMESTRDVQVAVLVNTDSAAVIQPGGPNPGMMSRVLFNLRSKTPHENGNWSQVFEFEQDTLSETELRSKYTAALHSARIDVPFTLHRSDKPELRNPQTVETEPAPTGLLKPHFLKAEFTQYESYLLKKSMPSILFALLVFGLTTLAFVLIFKNLRRQQKLSEQKNNFISNITHELKTPLTTVSVALEALSDFDALRNPEQTREYLAISKLELERLGLLVEKVLRLSQLDSSTPVLRKESLDMTRLVGDVLKAMDLQIKNAGAALSLELPPEGTCRVSGDRLHLSGVVFNLIDNALKYRRDPCAIHLSLRCTPEHAVLRVSDNGIGIPAAYTQKVFDKFFRVPAGNTHNVKGHGLGLSYCAQVLAHHQGKISVESAPDQGSTFSVEIPLEAAQPPA